MGLQLIICVEADKKSKSDWIYIKETIDKYYEINNVDFKLSTVYMGSKTRFNNASVVREINSFIRQYASTSKTNESTVIYAIDVDNIDSSSEDNQRWNNIKNYCSEKKYELVWFYKDIESAYIKRKVPDDEKRQNAEMFKRKSLINFIENAELNCDVFKKNSSNILCVFDKYLIRKTANSALKVNTSH